MAVQKYPLSDTKKKSQGNKGETTLEERMKRRAPGTRGQKRIEQLKSIEKLKGHRVNYETVYSTSHSYPEGGEAKVSNIR
jgi:hypothetical protein